MSLAAPTSPRTLAEWPQTFGVAESLILAGALPGYASRPGQLAAATTTEEFWTAEHEAGLAAARTGADYDPSTLLIDAPCGIGKSLAYLIPAILRAQHGDQRTVVSVTTRALQAQLAGKDLPFCEEHFNVEGIPTFTWAVLQGRSNYLCRNAAETADAQRVPALPQVLAYAADHPEWDGLRESLPAEVEITDTVWSAMCGDPDNCEAMGCSTAESEDSPRCYATRARRRAMEVDILVINHALLCTDLQMGARLLTDRVVVLDEAHEFEESTSSNLGARLVERTYTALAHSITAFVSPREPDGAEQVESLCDDVVTFGGELFDAIGRFEELNKKYPPEQFRLRDAQIGQLAEPLTRLVRTLSAALEEFSALRFGELTDRERKQRSILRRRLSNAFDRTLALATDAQVETVRWVETERRRNESIRVIRMAPVSVAPYLREHLFGRFPVLLVSGTLRVNGGFEFIQNRLGIDRPQTLRVHSPFNYREQGLLYVPTTLPEPSYANRAAYEAAAVEEIIELLRASEGRALVLFSSIKQMRDTAAAIRRRRAIPQTLMVQGEQPLRELMRRAREDVGSVLFGVKSLYTGIDIPGAALSMLIIAKLPFTPPGDAVFEARCEAIDAAGGSSWNDYSMPVMGLPLLQGLARLIRTVTDYGVVAILDSRLVTKGYGKRIMSDFPDFPLTRESEAVDRYFAAHRG